MSPGGWLLIAGFIFNLLSLAFYISKKNDLGKQSYNLFTLAVIMSSFMLVYHFLTNDFRLAYVIAYSSKDLPRLYALSSFWAGQEGSFLLWVFWASIVGLFVRRFLQEWERPLMIIYNLEILGLMILLVKQNPFRYASQVALNGRGLNPLLQNPWMAIHPPVMFLGYAAFGLPLAFAMVALWKKAYHSWVEVAYPWILFAWLFLGIGIILGGYWAYETLGWGGYWGWDPVENASFVPWIFVTALLHSLSLQKKQGSFLRTNFLLAILSYIFILYGTFLTRSGVLSDFSVHSFVDLGLTGWLLLVLGFFLIIGIGLFLWRLPWLSREAGKDTPSRARTLISLSVLLLVLEGVMVTLGTSSPLISKLWGKPSQVSTSFYVRTSLPIVAALLVVFTLYYWRKNALPLMVIPALVGAGIMYFSGIHQPHHLALSFLGLLGLGAILAQGRWKPIVLIHAGMVLFILGSLFATGYDKLYKITLEQHKPLQHKPTGWKFTFKDFRIPPGERHEAIMVDIQKGNKTLEVEPKLWFNERTQQLVANPHILIRPFYDIYVAAHEYHPPGMQNQRLALRKGETQTWQGMTFTFEGFEMGSHGMDSPQEALTVKAVLKVNKSEDRTLKPLFKILPDGKKENPFVAIPGTPWQVQLAQLDASSKTIYLGFKGPGVVTGARTVLEVTIIPLIGFVWLGSLLMILGGGWSILKVLRSPTKPA